MNRRVLKKIRRETRRFWADVLSRIDELTFRERLKLAWAILLKQRPNLEVKK